MPRLVHMTWVASQKRWTKAYKGTRYYVSAKELGCPPTMVESLLAANAWWERKRAEVDGGRQPDPVQEAVRQMFAGKTLRDLTAAMAQGWDAEEALKLLFRAQDRTG